MSGYYTVISARNAGTKPNPHGGTLVKWYVALRNQQGGAKGDIYWQRKEGSEVNVGDQIYGTVSQGEYGPRFKLEPKPDGATTNAATSAPSGPQTGSPARVAPPAASEAAGSSQTLSKDEENRKVSPEAGHFYEAHRQPMIIRQHSQEMAIRMAALMHEFQPPNVLTLNDIKRLTDHFHRDILESHSPPSTGQSPGTDDGGTGDPSSSAPVPPASLEQKVDEEIAARTLTEEFDEGGSF